MRALKRVVFFLIGANVLWHCAQPLKPTGGPKDVSPPRLLRTSPPMRARNVQPKKVVLTFNEFIDSKAQLYREIVVSPRLARQPDMWVINKHIDIVFKEPLRPNTTYSIVLKRGIKDENEKNPIPQNIIYAFSTGSRLDSATVSGQILSPLSGLGDKGFTVALYHPDSVAQKGFAKLNPTYSIDADSTGSFLIPYVPYGKFVLFGFNDRNRNGVYDGGGEKVARDYDPTPIRLDTLNQDIRRNLFSFQPDTAAPRLRAADLSGERTLILEFSEAVVAGAITVNQNGADTLRWTVAGTPPYLNEDPTRIAYFLQKPLTTDTLAIRLLAITDTVGNKTDTTVRKLFRLPRKPDRRFTLTAARPDGKSTTPENPYALRFYSTSLLDSTTARKYITLQDSGKKKIPFRLELSHYDVIAHLPTALDTLIKYTLEIDSALTARDGYKIDKRQSIAITYPRQQQFGALRGAIDSPLEYIIVVLFDYKQKRRYTSYGRSVNFSYLPPGEYNVAIIEDTDGNRRFTPGRVRPALPSEEVYYYPDKVRIRGGITTERFLLKYPVETGDE